MQALSRLSRANGGEYTGTFYALLPNNGETEVSIKHDNLVYTTDLKAENPVIDLGNLETVNCPFDLRMTIVRTTLSVIIWWIAVKNIVSDIK